MLHLQPKEIEEQRSFNKSKKRELEKDYQCAMPILQSNKGQAFLLNTQQTNQEATLGQICACLQFFAKYVCI